MDGLIVRPERPNDSSTVRDVTTRAFLRAVEADLVDVLRGSPGCVPELSLVAEVAGTLVGHVMLTRLAIRDETAEHPALVLAPLSVAPEAQRRGVGSALVRRVTAQAHAAGHRLVVLMGSPRYYPRFGFEPSAPLGIVQPFGTGPDAQVLFLDPAARGVVRGRVEYPDAWYTVPDVMSH